MRLPQFTSSRFREVCHARGETANQALAAQIIKGVWQTSAMKRGLELEPEVLLQYSDLTNVNVSQCEFVVHPDAPHALMAEFTIRLRTLPSDLQR